MVTASVIRTTVTPWSVSRGITFALIGAALMLAVVALVPMVYGILATASGAPDDAATLLTLALTGSSAALLFIALIPATYSDRRLKALRRDVRAAWGLPDELKMNKFSDRVPTPRGRPTEHGRRRRRRNR
ncbi:hypothetical protein ELQ93_05535 [Labedella gwakjiensis]|uniref:Uncharacterized protein n=1 Tax=Labedella gwakjiensis TaxID=390269 RepID=A0ABY0C8S2_9MICO|nr:hypothetical protein ELQ93_05535 [Labedella gwakjiensis]